jgi:hypothetical protein
MEEEARRLIATAMNTDEEKAAEIIEQAETKKK